MKTLASHSESIPESADPKVFGPALKWWRETFQQLGRLPSRADLSPELLTPAALPHVMLIDIADGGEKLRWRLLGTAHVNRNKEDLKGTDFDAMYAPGSPVLTYVKGLYRELIGSRRPIWTVNNIVHQKGHFGTDHPLKVHRLMLPLTTSNDEVDLCLAVQTVKFNEDFGLSYRDLWRNSDYVGEVEREILCP